MKNPEIREVASNALDAYVPSLPNHNISHFLKYLLTDIVYP